MKIAFRNFLTTLRRYKISSLLNVIGLTLAFTAFYVIMTQVWWELGYNRSLHEADRIYLVENEDWYEPGKWSSWLNRPVPSVSSLRRRGSKSGAACGAVSAPEPVGRATSLRSGIISFLLPAVRYRCLSSMFSLSVRSRAMCMTSENRRASSFPARRPERMPGRRGQPHMGRHRRTPARRGDGSRGGFRRLSGQFVAGRVRGGEKSGRNEPLYHFGVEFQLFRQIQARCRSRRVCAPVDEREPGDAARGGRETCGGRGRRR